MKCRPNESPFNDRFSVIFSWFRYISYGHTMCSSRAFRRLTVCVRELEKNRKKNSAFLLFDRPKSIRHGRHAFRSSHTDSIDFSASSERK